MRNTLSIALLSGALAPFTAAWHPLDRDTSREAMESKYSASLTANPSYISSLSSLRAERTGASYQSYLASRSSEKAHPTRVAWESSREADWAASATSSLGPHITTAIFFPDNQAAYISAIGHGGDNAETTTYVAARDIVDQGPYGYWGGYAWFFKNQGAGEDYVDARDEQGHIGALTKPYVTFTAGPTTVEWTVTYGGMAISDVAGQLNQGPSYLPTQTFSGSCSYTSIPAASPNPDIKTEFMEHEQIIYLPDDMFPTRTAVCTADQELWITHGVFPTGTGKPFGQSTYTMVNKGYAKWHNKILLESYTPWDATNVAKTTIPAFQSSYEAKQKSEFEAHGFHKYGSLGNHYTTTMFMPGVQNGYWVSKHSTRPGQYATPLINGARATAYNAGSAGSNPRSLKEYSFHIGATAISDIWNHKLCSYTSVAPISPAATCASRKDYEAYEPEQHPTRRAVCTVDGRDGMGSMTYTNEEGVYLDNHWPTVTVVRVHETDMPTTQACETSSGSTSSKASKTSHGTAAQTGTGVRPSGPYATGGFFGNGTLATGSGGCKCKGPLATGHEGGNGTHGHGAHGNEGADNGAHGNGAHGNGGAGNGAHGSGTNGNAPQQHITQVYAGIAPEVTAWVKVVVGVAAAAAMAV